MSSRVLVGDPGGSADEHEAANESGSRQREMERHPATEGVTEIVGFTSCLCEARRAVPESFSAAARESMPGKIDREDQSISSEHLSKRAPAAGILREPVGEHQGLAVSALDRGETPGWLAGAHGR